MKTVPLLEVASLASDRVRPWAGQRGYVATGDADDSGHLSPTMLSYDEKPSRADLTARPGDVLMARMAGTQKIFEIDEVSSKHVYSTGFAVLRPDASSLEAGYLRHWLRTSAFQLAKDRYSAGATQRAITNAGMRELTIPMCGPSEQRRIAAILDHADALRAKRLEVQTVLGELKDSMFRETQDGARTTMRLDEAYWFQEGPGIRKWQFTLDGVKLLNVGNIVGDGSIDLSRTQRHISTEEATGRYKHFLVDEGDLVIASSGISIAEDGLLRTRGSFVAAKHLPLCMNTSTIRFKAVDDRSDLVYLQAWLGSNEFRQQITRLVTGSAQKNFGPSHLKQLTITLPPLRRQHEFRDRVAAIPRSDTVGLDELFASLQSRAFRGEL